VAAGEGALHLLEGAPELGYRILRDADPRILDDNRHAIGGAHGAHPDQPPCGVNFTALEIRLDRSGGLLPHRREG
jgi:hypothetical protein